MSTVLVLRKCFTGGKSNNDTFTYPASGPVEAPDWDGKPGCGGGLHGLKWGQGSFNISFYGELFQLIEVDDSPDNLIGFTDKCKFHKGNVIYTGDRAGAISLLKNHPDFPKDTVVNCDINYNQIAISGYDSTQKAGDYSNQQAEHYSIQQAGNNSIQKAGHYSNQQASYNSIQKAGDDSIQESGYSSTQETGNNSIQKTGNGSTQQTGINSIQIGFWYDENGKYRVVTRVVTEELADKKYLFEAGIWTEVKD